jgi:hypothetical protein
MKKLLPLAVFLLAACAPAPVATPVDTTATPIMNQYPTQMPTPTLAVKTRPVGEDQKEEAYHFFYELKNHVALKDYEHFAEAVRYPITVQVDGQPKTFVYAAEFEANLEKILGKDAIQKFISTDESELVFTPQGIRVADGKVWFDLICTDSDCKEAEFMVTEIKN